jgi:hypothetical protein
MSILGILTFFLLKYIFFIVINKILNLKNPIFIIGKDLE